MNFSFNKRWRVFLFLVFLILSSSCPYCQTQQVASLNIKIKVSFLKQMVLCLVKDINSGH